LEILIINIIKNFTHIEEYILQFLNTYKNKKYLSTNQFQNMIITEKEKIKQMIEGLLYVSHNKYDIVKCLEENDVKINMVWFLYFMFVII